MNVLYTCDNNYIWLMGISVISLFENNKTNSDITVYLLGENISDKNEDILENIGRKYNRDIIIMEVSEIDIPDSLVTARWPLSAFTRLFSGKLLPESIHKILYLDCDTIVKGDIRSLDEVELGSNICGGIKDCIGKTYKENIGLQKNGLYINAGVLLLNLDELRKVNVKAMIDDYMKKYLKLINYADQDILNGIFEGKIKVLPPQFNVMTIAVVHSYEEIVKLRKPTNYYSKKEISNAVCNPIIVHYTTNMTVVRPWYSNATHPLTKEFKIYMEISPWKDKELTEMKFRSKETKIITVIEKLPSNIANSLLGVLHSELKPRYIKMKSKI